MQKPRPVYPSFALVISTRLRRHLAWADRRRLRRELREAFSRLQMGSARDMDMSDWSMVTLEHELFTLISPNYFNFLQVTIDPIVQEVWRILQQYNYINF